MKYVSGWMLIAIGILGMIISVSLISSSVTAQNTAPTWEYAVLVYGNNDASIFTGDSEADSALTGLIVPQDSSASNIPLALNVLGAEGWELVEVIPGGSTIYMFKRPE